MEKKQIIPIKSIKSKIEMEVTSESNIGSKVRFGLYNTTRSDVIIRYKILLLIDITITSLANFNVKVTDTNNKYGECLWYLGAGIVKHDPTQLITWTFIKSNSSFIVKYQYEGIGGIVARTLPAFQFPDKCDAWTADYSGLGFQENDNASISYRIKSIELGNDSSN